MIKRIGIYAVLIIIVSTLFVACNKEEKTNNNMTNSIENKLDSNNPEDTTKNKFNTTLTNNQMITKLLKEYDLRYMESIKNLKHSDFKDLFIDNTDTLIARRKFDKELIIRRNSKTQFSEYQIDYNYKGDESFKFSAIDKNNIKVDFHKGIKYKIGDNWNSQGIICSATVKFNDGLWKISSYVTDEADYKFLDSLKGKTDSDKYAIINQHYDDSINELKNKK